MFGRVILRVIAKLSGRDSEGRFCGGLHSRSRKCGRCTFDFLLLFISSGGCCGVKRVIGNIGGVSVCRSFFVGRISKVVSESSVSISMARRVGVQIMG